MKKKTLIIAEAGVNHNGDLGLAKDLIDVAAKAGADYVKFQTFIAKDNISKKASKAAYQIKNTGNNTETQLEMVQKLELSREDHISLMNYCVEKKINFLSTAFDFKSIYLLKDLGITLAKIPSGEITNYPYLKKIAQLFPYIVMSTGMANLQEIKDAFNVLVDNGAEKDNITILHCNTEYPTPFKDVNLRAMCHIQKELGVKVGYSDHTLGIEVPIAAVTLGAQIIEKHFTLDRNLPGPDHKASLEPQELKNMVMAIRRIEKALEGSGIKEPSLSEIKNIEIARKSIVASKYIEKGEKFTNENITTKRPGTGISPMRWNEILGKSASRNYTEEQLIENQDV